MMSALAPWIEFPVSSAMLLLGISMRMASAAFILLFVSGGALAPRLFARIVTPDQIRAATMIE